jgi:tetratricopeptide (TPR) repeat protein
MTYKEIDIQYVNKPDIKIPSSFNKPLILVNLYENKRLNNKECFEFAIDSLAAEESALSLRDDLNNSPWFAGLKIPIRKYFRIENSQFIKPIPWKVVKSIANQDSADLVISLEYIKINESTDSYKKQNSQYEYYYGYICASIYCYWRVYDVVNNKISSSYLYRDTLIWDANDWVPVSIGNQIPGFFNASAYAGRDCGEKYAIKIAPIWTNDRRILFHIGSKGMEEAANFAIKGQWLEAASEWQKVFALNKRKLSAKAAFNLALANEMLEKFDIALEWLRKAKKLYPMPEIDNYTSTIEDRINNSLK